MDTLNNKYETIDDYTVSQLMDVMELETFQRINNKDRTNLEKALYARIKNYQHVNANDIKLYENVLNISNASPYLFYFIKESMNKLRAVLKKLFSFEIFLEFVSKFNFFTRTKKSIWAFLSIIS
jgi:hypothetical protein